MKYIYTILSVLITGISFAQKANNTIVKANELYKKGEQKNAESAYDEALKIDSKNTTALFNKGNSLFKQNKFSEATKQYQSTAETTTDAELQAKAYYNKAVTEIKQQQARENLQKLLTEINKQKQQQQQPKPQEEKPKDKPLTKEQAAKQLEMLRNEEKRLQKEIQQQKNKPSRNEKDW